MNTPPLVSVRLVTYNHEKWIAQCLESILMQRTDFPFEVIVGEDCSTDGTLEIVLAYAERHPDKIRVLPAEANLGAMTNSYRVQQACRGKYHAMIEGDDYWIDPLKLQKQVDFMEANPDMTLCFHNVFVVNDGQPQRQPLLHRRRAGHIDLCGHQSDQNAGGQPHGPQ